MSQRSLNKFATAAAVMALFYLTSCKSTQTSTSSTIRTDLKELVKDSSSVRDTVYSVKGDTAVMSIYLEGDSGKVVSIREFVPTMQKVGRATVKAKIKNNVLTVEADCDSVAILQKMYYQLYERYTKLESDSSYTQKEIVTVTRPLTKFDWFLRILLAIVVTYSLVKAYNWIRKIYPI